MDEQHTVFAIWDDYLQKPLLPHKYAIATLLILGILTTIVMLFAYAPADGADGMDYYLYAAYVLGADLPEIVTNVSPVFPLFLAALYAPVGSFILVIIVHSALSSIYGLIYYLALRPYSPSFAFIVGIIILFDAQVRSTFSFLATEPIYVTLLAVAYLLALRPRKEDAKWITKYDILLIIVLLVLMQTRTVAFALFVPIFGVYILKSLNWRVMLGGLLILPIGFGILSFVTASSDFSQVLSYSRNLFGRPIERYSLMDAEDGEAAAQFISIREQCSDLIDDISYGDCLREEAGGSDAYSALRSDAKAETLSNNQQEVMLIIVRHILMFMQGTGHRFTTAVESPANAQCELPLSNRVDRAMDMYLLTDWRRIDVTPVNEVVLADSVTTFVGHMCPPFTSSLTTRQIVYTVANFYDVFALRWVYIWGLVLVIGTVLIKPLRKLWYPFALAGGLWSYHAVLSAMIINVQPRYILVTNSLRIIIVCGFVLVCMISLHRLIDVIRSRGQSKIS